MFGGPGYKAGAPHWGMKTPKGSRFRFPPLGGEGGGMDTKRGNSWNTGVGLIARKQSQMLCVQVKLQNTFSCPPPSF